MRYTDEQREQTYRKMDRLREEMFDEAIRAVYALNGDAVLRAGEHAAGYFRLLEEWMQLGQQLDAPPPGTGCA